MVELHTIMSVLHWIGNLFQPDAAFAVTMPANWSAFLEDNGGQASFSRLASVGYDQNELIQAGIWYTARTLSSAPLVVKSSTGGIIENHPILPIIRHPSPGTTGVELLTRIVQHLYLDGNAFAHVLRSNQVPTGTAPLGLQLLQPDHVTIQTQSVSALIHHYSYEVEGRGIKIDPKDMLHIRIPSPHSSTRGQSPISAAVDRIVTDNNLSKYIRRVLRFSGMAPAYSLSLKSKLSSEDKRILLDAWQQKTEASDAPFMLIHGEGKLVPIMGNNLKELQVPELLAHLESRILMGMGISPILLGAASGLSNSTYANYDQASAAFWLDTVIPLQTLVAGGLSPLVEPDHLEFDNTNVLAIRKIMEQKEGGF